MFALPGLLLLFLLDYLRPQEFFPVFRELRLLYVGTALAALGLLLDLRLGLSRLRPAPHLLLTALFVLWSLFTLALREPALVLPRAFSLLVPIAVYLLVAHALQSLRALQLACGTLLAICLLLASLGVVQGTGREACYRVALVDGDIRWLYDGRPCADRLDCEGEGAEPGAEYACERVGVGERGSVRGRVRWVGTMEDPNELSLVLGIGLPFAFAFLDRRRTVPRALLAAGAAALIGLCTYYTRSRGGQLVFLSVLAVYFARRVGVRRGLAAAVALALPVLLFGGRSGTTAEASTSERVETWWIGLHLFTGSPLLGVGSGRFTEYHYLTAHNSFILAAAELGFPGLVLFVGILWVSARIPLAALGRAPPPAARAWSLALLAALAGLVVGATFLSFMYKNILWIYVGLSGALYQAMRRHDPGFEVRFGPRDLVAVTAVSAGLVLAHVAYTGAKLGW